ncbi:unnamed protein product, partial [Scytosiphon promiscuus]
EKDSKDNAQQAGSGTVADTSRGPSTDGSMDDGAGSIGSASPSPEATTGGTDIAAAAPESSGDSQVGKVEDYDVRDDAKAETDVVVTDNNPGEAEDTSAGHPPLYEYMGCVRLNSAERRATATIPPMAMMTPMVCVQACGDRDANIAGMVHGNICMCSHEEN